MKFLNIFFVLLIFIFHKNVESKIIEISCFKLINSESESSYYNFKKKINLELGTIIQQTDTQFDKIISISERTVIFSNTVFETYSVFDLTSYIWTIYSEAYIDVFRCK